MKKARERQGAGDAEAHRNRVQSMSAVKFTILQRIDDIEASQPENDRETEKHRYYQLAYIKWGAGYSQPGADRRNRERQTQK